MTDIIKIPFLNLQAVNAPLQAELIQAATGVVAGSRYVRGTAVKRFEQHYADYIGTRHCVGVSNGLDALKLIYRAYIELGRLQVGDEIIVPANTYIASILALTDNGLKPVLVEPDAGTLQMSFETMCQALTPNTRSVMLVHLYGRCAYSDEIEVFCQEHNLLLVEDNAQAHGCAYKGRRTGALGHAAGHSFYPTKNLGAMGDAGAVTTNDEQLAHVVSALANYGSTERYRFDYAGCNCRLDELQAAILDVKLQHLDAWNQRRRELAQIYYANISNPAVRLPKQDEAQTNVYHLFPIFAKERDQLRNHLLAAGIQTDVHYPIPPHKQKALLPLMAQLRKEGLVGGLPLTEQIHCEEISLPLNTAMTNEEALFITEVINKFTPIIHK